MENQINSLKKFWKKSILVCGCGRSGTSILSNFLASHKNVEYSFDSPLLHWLFASMKSNRNETLNKLLEIYLYREIFKGSLLARNLNINFNDQTNIKNFKTKKEILMRQKSIIDNKVLIDKLSKHHLCIKLTDATFKLNLISKILSGISIVGIVRSPGDTIHSIYKKKWFSNLNNKSMNLYDTLPFRLGKKKVLIPYWLKKSDLDLWLSANEFEKAAIYYARANSSLLNYKSKIMILNYDKFVESPNIYAKKLSSIYKLKQTKYSKEILSTIKPMHSLKKKLPKNIRTSLLKEINYIFYRLEEIDILNKI